MKRGSLANKLGNVLNIHPISLALTAIAALCAASHSWAIDSKTIERRSIRIADTLQSIQFEESSRIPASILNLARGIIILRQYEAGFGFGVKGGFGVAIARDKRGKWGPPAWLKTGEGSAGFQIGVQKLNVAFLLMNENGLNLLQKPKFRIGVDAAATFGPSGGNIQAKIGGADFPPVLVYTDTEGLFAGASVDLGFLLPYSKANFASYGKKATIAEIVLGDNIGVPNSAKPIIDALKSIEAE